MNKLKVGDYAYSKHSRDYGIGKIVNIHTNGFAHQEVEIQFKDVKISTRYDYVVGSSSLIDLIEVGDYVNGYKIVKIFTNRYNGNKVLIALQRQFEYEYSDDINDYMCDDSIHIYNEDIKTVVTHEQFSQMEYKVGDSE